MSSQTEITFEIPKPEDGSQMWRFVQETSLDNNSPYKYILMSKYFTKTCLVAKNNGIVIGFITAFIPPNEHNCLFVWQIGVSPEYQGKQIAISMLKTLLSRNECKDIHYVEATITPSNNASQSLFKKLAKDCNTTLTTHQCILKEHFPHHLEHEEELLYRIGPINLVNI